MTTHSISRVKQVCRQTDVGEFTLYAEFDNYQSVLEGIADVTGGNTEGEEFEGMLQYKDAALSTTWTRCVFVVDSGKIVRVSTERTKKQGEAASEDDVDDFISTQDLIIYGTATKAITEGTESVSSIEEQTDVINGAPSTAGSVLVANGTDWEGRELTTADISNFNDGTVDDWHYVGDVGEPAFLNSWENYALSNHIEARFCLVNGVVHVQGLVKNGSPANSYVFLLPEGYRPDKKLIYIQQGAAGGYRYDINPTGEVDVLSGGSATYVSINATFLVDPSATVGPTGATGPAGADSTVPGPIGETGPEGPQGVAGTDGSGIDYISRTGRFYLYADGRWVTDSDDNYGPAYYQFIESGTTAVDPVIEWEWIGEYIPAGTTIKALTVIGRTNTAEVTEIEFYLAFKGISNARLLAGYDNDAEHTVTTLHRDNWMNPVEDFGQAFTGSNTNDVRRRRMNFTDYTTTEDGYLMIIVKATGQTVNRYFLHSHTWEVQYP